MKMKRVLTLIVCLAVLLPSMLALTPLSASAASPDRAEYVGNVKLSGDPAFDSDSIVNSDADQWRWLSYPESRMVVNPGSRPSYDGGMNLNLGLFVNGVRELTNLQKIQMSATGQSARDAVSISTAWYPYKLTANASYGSDGTVEMTEFFVDKNTFVRYVEASGVSGKTMTMSAAIDGMTVLSDNSILINSDGYYFVYKVMLLNEDSSVKETIRPEVSGKNWAVSIPFTDDAAKVAFSLTLAAKVDDSSSSTVISRANTAVSGKLSDKLAATKTYWDGKLGKVPAPTVWGIQGVDAKGVTPEQHRRSFYAAWAFNYQNILEPTPETGYDYYQITLGKASMYTSGTSGAPNSCAWESMFDIQQMAYVEPDIAWSAAEGFINSIDDNGILSGESLPSQKAHMVWVCYENKPDNQELNELYPKIKKYLQWRYNNPHWGIGGRVYQDEKDISFVMQWYSDVNYAIKICQVLGKYDDISMWENLQNQMSENARQWFFTPSPGDSSDKIYNFCFTDSGLHYEYDRQADVPNYIASALYADFPKDLTDRLVDYYLKLHDSSADLVGFDFYKYGDGCHIAYALLEREKEYPQLAGMWKEYINAALRNVVKSVEFSEESRPDKYYPQGVQPSTFTASTMIDFTYMNNGMRMDLGTPVAIADGEAGLQTTSDSDVTVYTIKGTHPNLPKSVPVKDKSDASLDAYVSWDAITDDQCANAGTVTVNGTVADTNLTATATVKVYGGNVQVPVISAKTVAGEIPVLPSWTTATYSEDGADRSCVVSITWDKMDQSDFGKPGTVKAGGTIGFNNQRVEAEVEVIDASAIESSTGQFTVVKGSTLQLSVKDSAGNPCAVTWGIEDSGYDPAAGINQNGLLLGVKGGTVTVTAQIEGVPTPLTKEITVTGQNTVSFAYGGTATALSQADSARSPAQAIDEDFISMWRAADNNDSQWFQLQMKRSVPITGVKIRWYEGDQPQAFVLKTSEDGLTWDTIYTRSAKIDTGKTDYSEIIVLDQTKDAKYVRMESSKAGNYQIGIQEFQVFGAPQATVPAQDVNITSQTGEFKIVNKGVTLQLGATVTPDDASDARVEWSVADPDGSDTDRATVSSTGVVTPLKDGTVTVTAAAVDGFGAEASKQVTISNQDLTNAALNKPATATTNGGSSNLPSAAVDGDRATRWGSQSGAPQQSEFKIDLQGEYTLSTIALYFDSGAYPIDFKLQYSMDNMAWSDIEAVTGNNSPNRTFIFAPINAKYVRTISSKTTNPGWGYSIYEFEVYGKELQVEKAPAEIASEITTLEPPVKGATKLTLPSVEGYDISIKSSGNGDVIALDGTITPPDEDTNVKLVLIVSKDGTTADTKELTVTVPGIGNPPSIDKSALQKLYDANKDRTKGRYTDTSWDKFTDALNNAKAVLENVNAAQPEIDTAGASLSAAVNGLELLSSGGNSSVGTPPSAPPTAPVTFVSDTNSALSVNGAYTFKITSKDGKTPVFVVGTPGIFTVQLVQQSGNDYFYKITAIGAADAQAGVYVNGTKLLVATVKSGNPTFVSDTGAPLSVNSAYTFKITSKNGKAPVFVVGTPGIFTMQLVKHTDNDYFYKITASGAPGDQAGVYVNGTKLLVATVKTNPSYVLSDTHGNFKVKSGKTYVFKLTANAKPNFWAGTSSVFKVSYVNHIGNNYYFRVTAVGKAGSASGFYIQNQKGPVAVAAVA